jgi:hypothetical protein
MHAALSSVLTASFTLLDTIQCKTKLDLMDFRVWEMAPCDEGDAEVQLITVALLVVTNLEIFTVFFYLSAGIDCSITKQHTTLRAETFSDDLSIVVTKALLQPFGWEGSAHLFLWMFESAVFIAGIVKRFVQRHVLSRSPSPPWSQSLTNPFKISHRSRYVQKCFTASIIW